MFRYGAQMASSNYLMHEFTACTLNREIHAIYTKDMAQLTLNVTVT